MGCHALNHVHTFSCMPSNELEQLYWCIFSRNSCWLDCKYLHFNQHEFFCHCLGQCNAAAEATHWQSQTDLRSNRSGQSAY